MVKNVSKAKNKKNNIPFVISISVLVLLFASYFIFPSFQEGVNEAYEILTSDDELRIKKYVSQYGMWGPIVIIVAMVLQMFLFVIPNILLMMIAILSYGPVWGSVLSLVGVFAASSTGYAIGTKLSPLTLQRFVSERMQKKIGAFITDYGMGAIMITRLSSFSNDALSFVAGLLSMGYRKFIIATLVGITPLIATLAIFGRSGKIEKALIWIAVVSLALLVVYIIIDKRKKHKKGRKS